MPWGLRYLEPAHCAVLRYEGTIDLPEMLASAEAAFSAPFFETKNLIGLSDWRQARADLSYEDWRHYEHLLTTRFAEARRNVTRWAYLTDNAIDTANGFLHLHKVRKPGRDLFSTLEGASEFLGVNLSPFLAELDRPLARDSA